MAEMRTPPLETLVDGLDFGEGPRWHDGRLWYSDFFQHRVSAVGLDGVPETVLELDDQPSGLGWLPDGRLLVVSMLRKQVLRVEPDGTVAKHADLSTVVHARCNDMVVAADGTAYVGNFGFEYSVGEPARTTVLARVQPDGAVDVVADELAFPNGTVITPDGRTLVVGETMGSRYTAFDIAADGSLRNRRLWAELPGIGPDGCTLDAEGAIWCANCFGTDVVRVREGGEILDRVDVGQPCFACALGGDDGRTLFVLSADSHDAEAAGKASGVIRLLRADVPHAGLP
jgi:sugar lactone lactonase YvrE